MSGFICEIFLIKAMRHVLESRVLLLKIDGNNDHHIVLFYTPYGLMSPSPFSPPFFVQFYFLLVFFNLLHYLVFKLKGFTQVGTKLDSP